MIGLFDLLVVAAILGFAYWGWLVGLQAAGVAALELTACLAVAVVLHEPLAGILHAVAVTLAGDAAPQSWSILLAFAALAWGSFAGLRYQFHRGDEDDDGAEIDPLSDRLAGGLAGGLGGAIFAGGVLVTLSMVPFLAGLKPSGDRLLLDAGKWVLRMAGQFTVERHQGRSLPLDGEPPSRMTVLAARLTSEPWFDADDDGNYSDADRFRDVDGNGTFTKDLYFDDVDGDGLRRVGLVDKYVAGRWDGLLLSQDRPRPVVKQPAPAAGPAAGSPAKPAKSAPGGVPGPAAAANRPGKSRPPTPAAEPVKGVPAADPSPPTPPPARLPEDDF